MTRRKRYVSGLLRGSVFALGFAACGGEGTDETIGSWDEYAKGCGNGVCSGKEDCSSCPSDCGVCAPPPGTGGGSTGTAIPSSSFGMHVMNQSNSPTVSFGSLGKAASVGWCYVERTKGVFSWSHLDSWADYAAAHGQPIFYSHYCVPKWAAKDPSSCVCLSSACTVYNCPSTVANLNDWTQWVTALVTRYRNRASGSIRIWELWNEPYLGTPGFQMTPPEFVAMANATHDIIRALDPGATIVGPSGHASDYDAFWAAGMTHDLDIISTHGYPSLGNPTAESLVPARMDAIKAVMADYNVSKPIWDTEGSWGIASLTSDQQVAFVARFHLLHWANGVSRAYWYAWDNGSWGLLQGTAAATAYQMIHDWMVGATMPNGCSISGSVYACALTRPNGYQGLVVWNTSGSSSYTPSNAYVKYRDLSGNTVALAQGAPITIGIKPILLENQ